MKKFDLTTEWDTYKDCYFVKNTYVHNDGIELEIWNLEDGPIATLTRYITATSSENAAYVDTNNCPWAEKFIKELGIGKATGNYTRSGFCTYPEYEFDMDKLREYMSEEE